MSLFRSRMMPGTEVVLALPRDCCPYRHVRYKIHGVVDRRGRVTFYSSVTRGYLRIPLGDLRRAGYTIRRAEA